MGIQDLTESEKGFQGSGSVVVELRLAFLT